MLYCYTDDTVRLVSVMRTTATGRRGGPIMQHGDAMLVALDSWVLNNDSIANIKMSHSCIMRWVILKFKIWLLFLSLWSSRTYLRIDMPLQFLSVLNPPRIWQNHNKYKKETIKVAMIGMMCLRNLGIANQPIWTSSNLSIGTEFRLPDGSRLQAGFTADQTVKLSQQYPCAMCSHMGTVRRRYPDPNCSPAVF